MEIGVNHRPEPVSASVAEEATRNPFLPATEEEYLAELRDISVSCAPRRFTLCEIDRELQDGWVFGWGLAFEDNAVLFRPGDHHVTGVFQSAESALRLFSSSRNLHLVWIDPEPAPEAVTA
ncbi:hypothetical protein LI90_3547 [Carbonactinospora thermoautotrophica]|uniref:Uncharacterized protein n=1 Tax=Carbonactinospora thermoautotrophica TaxID=1469144 RepID=A0A132MXG4_9ACTN|nr:hypothetical protein [Carbonactinospora thermoautotrophica]KWX02504.1 hypothetical protein LI90_3547 [Carbonactinospora thermoautotrophica]